MRHNAVVSKGPSRTAGTLLTHEPVLNAQYIVRERPVIKDMSESSIELVVLLIRDLQNTILNPECIPVIVIQVITSLEFSDFNAQPHNVLIRNRQRTNMALFRCFLNGEGRLLRNRILFIFNCSLKKY
jgi:hypothetical protein